MLRTTCHEKPNNIVIVPVNLPNLPNNTIPIVGQSDRNTKPSLPVAADQIDAFYSDNIDPSCYFDNVQCSSFSVDTQHDTSSSCSKYSCHQNLVELTELSTHRTPTMMTYSPTTKFSTSKSDNNKEVIVEDKETKDKAIKSIKIDKEDEKKHTSPKVKKSAKSINKVSDSHDKIIGANNKVSSFTASKQLDQKLHYSHKDNLKKDIKFDSMQNSVEGKQSSRTEPCRSKSKIHEGNKNTKRVQDNKDTIDKMKKRSNNEREEKNYSTERNIERKSTIKDRRDTNDRCECSPTKRSKLRDDSKDVNSLKQKQENEKKTLGNNTIPKFPKSKNFTILQRYLAYQRFLRNCTKNRTKAEKINDESEKVTYNSKSNEKTKEPVIESSYNIELMRTKEQSKEIVTLNADHKLSRDDANKKETSNLHQNQKKKDHRKNCVSKKDLKNKGEITEKKSKILEITENKEKYKTKIKNHIDGIKTKDQTNESISTYLVQKKNKEQSKEPKVNSKNKLYKYKEEKMNKEESKKRNNAAVDVLQSSEQNKETLELSKKRREHEEKRKFYVDKKESNNESDERTIRRLEKKEKKHKDKIRSLKQKNKLTKISKTYDEQNKIKKKLKSKIIRNLNTRDDVSEKDEIVSENIQLHKNTHSINRENEDNTKRTVNVSKNSSSRLFINKRNNETDLRAVLARNKTKNEHYVKHKYNKIKPLQRENLLITVKQNVNNENTTPKVLKIKQIKRKPILKKSKSIKLVINIKCSNSAVSSDDSNMSGNESPTQDLSFLDDFDVDEIVNSLNINTHNFESNITLKKFSEEKNFNTIQEDAKEIKTEPNIDSIKSLELGERCTTNHNKHNDKCSNVMSDKCVEFTNDNKHIVKLEANYSNMDVVVERYNDDIYEVIDITNDENSIILLEDDTTDVVASNQQDNFGHEKVCNELENMLKTGTSSSDAIIKDQNEVILIDDDSTNAMHSETDSVIKDQQKNNKENIEDCTFIEIENMLSKITHANVECETPNTMIKIQSPTKSITFDEHRKSKITYEENKNSVRAIEMEATNKINIEGPVISKENEENNISAVKYIDSSKTTNLDITTMDETYTKGKINVADKYLNDQGKQSDKMKISGNQTINDPINVATVPNPVKITKSDVIKGDKALDMEQPQKGMNNTHKNTSNVAILKNTNEHDDQNIKPERKTIKVQPKIAETTTKTDMPSQHCTKSTTYDIQNKEISSNTGKADSKKKTMETDPSTDEETMIKIDPQYEPIIRAIEHRMYYNLKEHFSISALIHKGYYSIIYKCTDTTGQAYALKILRSRIQNGSIYKDNILRQIQENTPNRHYPILEILNTFKSSGRLCYLTPYYSKTLTEALERNKKCFHIDLVKILSKQLVDAVTILTNNQIVHADISPKHVLLNHTNDRLKLTGFDRANFVSKINITPKTGTVSYRAPEIILGFITDWRIDVWATALVIFEMATGTQLFRGSYNNEILYQQLCTIGPLDFEMLRQSMYTEIHFKDMKFRRFLSKKKWVFVRFSGTNDKLHKDLFNSYNRDWMGGSQWQITKDLDKIEMLYSLLVKMLVLDPRHRLPICFVGANEFYDNYNMLD